MEAIMAEPLSTEDQLAQLLANGTRSANGEDIDHLFGLCDLGLGEPELGYVSLAEIRSVRGNLGLPIERDLYFSGQHPLSYYAKRARDAGRIVTD
jgi:hypothetical protein